MRHHQRRRKAKFDPIYSRDSPIPHTMLMEKRVTHVKNQSGPPAEEDDWHLPKVKFKEEWWRGHTTFYIQDIEDARNYVAEKRGQDEVSLTKESDRDKEQWKISDLSEWNQVTQSGGSLRVEQSRH